MAPDEPRLVAGDSVWTSDSRTLLTLNRCLHFHMISFMHLKTYNYILFHVNSPHGPSYKNQRHQNMLFKTLVLSKWLSTFSVFPTFPQYSLFFHLILTLLRILSSSYITFCFMQNLSFYFFKKKKNR